LRAASAVADGGDQAGAEHRPATVCGGAVTIQLALAVFSSHARSKNFLDRGKDMQIILQEDIEKLGTRGQVVEVAEGYARNFLLPRKLALEASASNMKRLEKMRAVFAKKEATEREAAQKLAELLGDVTLEFARRAGDNDQLFGSVTSGDIADALAAKGYNVEKRKVAMTDPIKVVGEYEIPLKLHREISANVKAVVKKEE
jgi:large subunit ribosomal protein L9